MEFQKIRRGFIFFSNGKQIVSNLNGVFFEKTQATIKAAHSIGESRREQLLCNIETMT